jgi:hypothetical protein
LTKTKNLDNQCTILADIADFGTNMNPLSPDVQRFLSDIEPIEHAYSTKVFSYLAHKIGEKYYLLSGRITLGTRLFLVPEKPFSLGDVHAGCVPFNSLRELLESFHNGGSIMSFGKLEIPLAPGRVGVQYNQNTSAAAGQRLDILSIHIPWHDFKITPSLDWSLRFCSTPFDGLNDLASTYGMESYKDYPKLDVWAHPVMAVDQSSTINGCSAQIRFLLSPSAKPESSVIGYKVLLPGFSVDSRKRVTGSEIEWMQQDSYLRSELKFNVPEGAIVQCFLGYAGIWQETSFISDPKSSQNPTRVVYENFDSELANLKAHLLGEGKNKSADFEDAIANLFAINGFIVTKLDHRPNKEAPDILATVPQTGDMLIVECTIDTLKGDNKLGKLHSRVNSIRQRLASSGHAHLRVVPMIVTSRDLASISADVPEAERLGIVVVDRGLITEELGRSVIMRNAKQMFDKAFQTTQENTRRSITVSGSTP